MKLSSLHHGLSEFKLSVRTGWVAGQQGSLCRRGRGDHVLSVTVHPCVRGYMDVGHSGREGLWLGNVGAGIPAPRASSFLEKS